MTDMGLMGQMVCDASNSGTPFTPTTPPHPGLDGGFCSIRSLPSACRRRVAALMLQFPPFGGALDVGQAQPCTSHSAIPSFAGGEAAVRGGEVTIRGGVAPKVQTTSATNADNAVSWARWSAIWAQRRLALRGARANR